MSADFSPNSLIKKSNKFSIIETMNYVVLGCVHLSHS